MLIMCTCRVFMCIYSCVCVWCAVCWRGIHDAEHSWLPLQCQSEPVWQAQATTEQMKMSWCFLLKKKKTTFLKKTYPSALISDIALLLHNGRYAALSAYIIIKAYESLSAALSVQFYMWRTAWISIWFTPCVAMMSGQKVVQKRCYV